MLNDFIVEIYWKKLFYGSSFNIYDVNAILIIYNENK